MEPLSNRVRRVCEDLARIEEQLSLTAKQPPSAGSDEDVLAQDMKTLKDAIDETRAFLWSYFQRTASPNSERFTELTLAQDAASDLQPPATKTIDSFFEEIESLATRIVEKHMSPKPEIAEAD